MIKELFKPRAHVIVEDATHFLNILTIGYGSVLLIFLSIGCINLIKNKNPYDKSVIAGASVYLIFLAIVWILNNKTKKKTIAIYLFIFLIIIVPISISINWSPLFPQALLLYALVITITNVLIGRAIGIWVTMIISSIMIALVGMHVNGFLSYDTSWYTHLPRKDYPFKTEDAIAAATTLICIHLISLISNRLRQQALYRAQESEEQLRKERDHLEEKVIERTKELQEAQRQKFEEINKFASFGRTSSGIIHELVNPLMAMDLRLGTLINSTTKSASSELSSIREELTEAIQDVKRMEQVISASRRQFQGQRTQEFFNLATEIHNVHRVFEYQIRKIHIQTEYKIDNVLNLYGDPLKFNQLITNLMSNAIHACELAKKDKSIIKIDIHKQHNNIVITIEDSGVGIEKDILKHIYEPLFTTKSAEEGTGLGLYLCKKIVETDFNGNISCQSTINIGTTFTVTIPLKSTTIVEENVLAESI